MSRQTPRNNQRAFKNPESSFAPEVDPVEPIPEVETEPEALEATELDIFTEVLGSAPEDESPAAAPEPGAVDPVVSPAEPAVPEVSPAAKTFRVGSHTFNSQEEADAYVIRLESEAAYRQGLIDSTVVPAAIEPEINPADILFEDPTKAFELFEKKLRSQWDAEKLAATRVTENANAIRNTWDSFYAKHPDLAEHKELVDMVANLPSTRETFGKLTIDKALPELGKATRVYMAKLRGKSNGGEQLQSDPAVTSGTGGVKIPVTKTPTPVTNFVSEVRQMKRK